MAAAGCGPTSAAILLSGYGKDVTPVKTADYMIKVCLAIIIDCTRRKKKERE